MTGFGVMGPADDERHAQTRLVHGRFATRKLRAVVAEINDERVVGFAAVDPTGYPGADRTDRGTGVWPGLQSEESGRAAAKLGPCGRCPGHCGEHAFRSSFITPLTASSGRYVNVLFV